MSGGIVEATVPAVPATADRPGQGILLLLAALFCFSCSDVCAKLLNASLPPVEIAWIRYSVYSLSLVPLVLRTPGALRSRHPALQILRGLGMIASAVFFILAIRTLKLADATATAFISPLFITALSIPVLGERVGIRRWAALVVGLAGVLLVVRPGGNGFSWASGFPILSAMGWAGAVVITRRMAGTDSALTTLIWSAGCGFVFMGALLPLDFVAPTARELAIGIFMGCANTAAQWLVVLAYRRADASLLAPFGYTQLIWATLLGFLVFGALPDLYTIAGAGVIIASGLYTAHRERVRRRAAYR